jgi:hypothetical protein
MGIIINFTLTVESQLLMVVGKMLGKMSKGDQDWVIIDFAVDH